MFHKKGYCRFDIIHQLNSYVKVRGIQKFLQMLVERKDHNSNTAIENLITNNTKNKIKNYLFSQLSKAKFVSVE